MNFYEDLKAVIFDLDGTLYQDKQFYRRYLMHLVKDTAWEPEYDKLLCFMEDVLSGRAEQKMGHFYRHSPYSHFRTVSEVLDFTTVSNQGDPFEEKFYDNGYFFIGDAWALTGIIRLRLGLKGSTDAFLNTRREMLMPEYIFETSNSLVNAIEGLTGAGISTYLFTNTQSEGAVKFVDHLGLGGKLSAIEYGIGKPYGLAQRLPDILKRAGASPEQVLSIGDHSFNDLSPVRAAGGHTVLVSPYVIHDNVNWDMRLSSLDELDDCIRNIIKNKEGILK